MRATGGRQSLDDNVRHMIRLRRLPGAAYGIDQWQEMLEAQIGTLAKISFTVMKSGKWLIRIPEDAFGPCFPLKRVDQYEYDLGFDEHVIGRKTGTVTGLKPGSRAETAGLRNGDKILWNQSMGNSLEAYESTMKLRVVRPGEDKERFIEYWPRSWQKTEAWEVEWAGDACQT
jgi:predicted metalloprotease with PDZ domain